MVQSKKISLIESTTQVIVGYIIALITQIIVFPWFGIYTAILENFKLAFIFASLAFIKSYVVRRLFNGTN